MALHHPGDVVPHTGYYQCIFCRQVIYCTQGSSFPPCPGNCKSPAYAFTDKTK